jgi:hypothetical protein
VKAIYLKILWIITLPASIFLYAYFVINPELIYHTQQPAFLANKSFFNQFLNYPGGIAEYIGLLISQLLYSRLSGSLTIMLISFVFILLVRCIISPVLDYSIAGLIQVLYLFVFIPLLNNYYFPVPVIVQSLLTLTALALVINSTRKGVFYYLLLVAWQIALYYCAGIGALALYTIAVIVFLLFRDKTKKSLFFIIAQLICLFGIPLIGYEFIFNISLKASLFQVLPEVPVMLQYKPNAWFYIFYAMPVIIVVLSLVVKYKSGKLPEIISIQNKKTKRIIQLTAIMLLILCAIVNHKNNHSFHEKNIALADYYCYHEDWNKVIALVTKDPEYDISMNLCYNRAITNSGRFLDLFFNYPQYLGADILFPDKTLAGDVTMMASDYYYDLGYISESRHMAYEAQTLLPCSPRILKRLVETNLICGNYSAAKQFLRVLKDNCLYDDFVNKYTRYVNDTIQIANDRIFIEKRRQMPIREITYPDISDRLKVVVSRNFLNQKAYEHLQVLFLLQRKYGNFMAYLPGALLFYKTIPTVYEEGIMLSGYNSKGLSVNDYKISDQSLNAFFRMQKILQQYGNNPAPAKYSLNNYRHRYLYYLLYNSPEATKAFIKRPE